MFFVDAQLSLCTDVDSQCYTSTDPVLSCLVVAAPLSPSKKQTSSWSSHVVDLVDLHTLVAENSYVSHGAVKSDSLIGVVGRDQARNPKLEFDQEFDQELKDCVEVPSVESVNGSATSVDDVAPSSCTVYDL